MRHVCVPLLLFASDERNVFVNVAPSVLYLVLGCRTRFVRHKSNLVHLHHNNNNRQRREKEKEAKSTERNKTLSHTFWAWRTRKAFDSKFNERHILPNCPHFICFPLNFQLTIVVRWIFFVKIRTKSALFISNWMKKHQLCHIFITHRITLFFNLTRHDHFLDP